MTNSMGDNAKIVWIFASVLLIGMIIMVSFGYIEQQDRCKEQKIELTRWHELDKEEKIIFKMNWMLDRCYGIYPEVDLTRYK